MKPLLPVALLLASFPATAAYWPGPDTVTRGRVFYDKLDPHAPAFFYESRRTEEGGKTVITATYKGKDGSLLAVDESTFADGQLKRHVYRQLQTSEDGEVALQNGKADFVYRTGGETRTGSEDIEPDMLSSNMVGEHLAGHWQELMRGDTIKVRFLLIERTETIGFKFFKDGERLLNGKPVVDFTMKPSSFLIAALVKPIRVSLFKEEPHWIAETNGRTPIRVADHEPPEKRSDYHAIDARMEMDPPAAVEPAGTGTATFTAAGTATATGAGTALAATPSLATATATATRTTTATSTAAAVGTSTAPSSGAGPKAKAKRKARRKKAPVR